MHRGRVVAVVCLLLVASGGPAVGVVSAGGGPAAGDTAADGSNTTTGASAKTTAAEIRLERTVSLLPDRPGEVRLDVDVTVPDGVTRLELYLPGATTGVTATDGFERVGDRQYEWTGGADPSLSLRIAANRSASGTRIGDGSGYAFVDAGDWALVRVPGSGVGWSERAGTAASVVRTTTVDGPGATGGDIAYLGAVDRYERTAHSQRFELVVPERASLAADPDEILASMASAAGDLRIGARDDEVFVVAAPTGAVEWGVRGIQTGGDDLWVLASEPVDSASNVWLHEYVHTRQAFETTERTRWITEGSADYLAALLTLRQGRIDYAAFRDQLAIGTRPTYSDAVLADPATWVGRGSNYRKGALVLGAVDRQVRLASEGERGLEGVLAAMNEQTDPVSAAAFETLVADGNDSLSTYAERYTRTEATPEPWSIEDHRAAFDTAPAAIELTDLEATLTGPYRNRSVAFTASDPRRLAERPVVGERVAFTATVENAGGQTGTYDLGLTVDGAVQDRRTGSLEPGERRAVTFEVPVTAGDTRIRIGDRTLRVSGADPATATVEDLRVDPGTVDPGGSVTLRATVSAPEDRPAERTLRFLIGSRVVGERTVRLDAGERRTVTATATVDAAGRYAVGIEGGPTATLSVGAATGTAEPTEPGSDTGGDTRTESRPESASEPGSEPGTEPESDPAPVPGGGPAVALLALSVALAAKSVRRSS